VYRSLECIANIKALGNGVREESNADTHRDKPSAWFYKKEKPPGPTSGFRAKGTVCQMPLSVASRHYGRGVKKPLRNFNAF
jgi:hypothetical protein